MRQQTGMSLHCSMQHTDQIADNSTSLIGNAASIIPPKSQYFPGFTTVSTSSPVLFINTSGDPVTPTSSARIMSRLFKGSGVVIVEGPGHGYSSAPSKCADEAVATY